ncbi:Methylmalonyl-CoA mutase small subunit [Roseibium album]|nr:Methylmalonyl-CoA mutase small subunit [Roseibium album]
MSLSFSAPERFLSVNEEAWWASVDKALKGLPRQKLFETTEDGFENAPLYKGRTDTPARLLRASGQDWSIVQRIDIPDPKDANAQILEDLEGGANGLELVFSSATTADGDGIRVGGLDDVETLLEGVQLELVDLRLEAGNRYAEVLALMLAYLEKHKLAPSKIRIMVGNDPYGLAAAMGLVPEEPEIGFLHCQDVLESAKEFGSSARALMADGRVWHEAGATSAQELACVLASAAAHLRMLEGTKIAPEEWADQMSVSLVADTDQIGTIAKARAFRALWSCILDGADLPQKPIFLHMSTSYRMLTSRDPWVNLLRNTVATFAAGIGGADSIGVLPHTQAVGLPDAFARRLARNTQSILLEESNLAKVSDPAAGSGAIEDRTEKICATAWKLFQEIEAAGGMFDALRQGLVQEQIQTAGTDLGSNVARRKRPITGVSEFPNLAENDVSVLENESDGLISKPNPALDLPEPGDGQRFTAMRNLALQGKPLLVRTGEPEDVSDSQSVPALCAARVSAPFERLRSMTDELERRTNKPATIFLASIGSLAQFTARATWTANAFAVGGFGAVGPSVYHSLDELVVAYRESGAMMACIVSSDAVYEGQAEATARALKEAGAGYLYLAGKPGSREQAFAEAGVDSYLYAGCNLLALLEEAHSHLQESHGVELSDLEVLK